MGALIVVGFFDLNLVILAGDLALLIATAAFGVEARKIVEKTDDLAILKRESPIGWVKACVKFLMFSILTSISYDLISNQNLITTQPLNIDLLLVFSIVFFLFGLLQAVRVIWFIIDPASTANISVGNVLLLIADKGRITMFLLLIGLLQLLNGFIFYSLITTTQSLTPFGVLYVFSSTVSFFLTGPLFYTTIAHSNKETTVLDAILIVSMFLPWVVLIMASVLN
jgi:hypothetical protein